MHTWIVGTAVAGLVLAQAASASAQCPVVGFKGASKQKVRLSRSYADCTAPDVTTVDGIDACSGAAPVAGAWAADPAKTKGEIKLKGEKGGDVSVQLKLKGVLDSGDLTTPATGTGALRLTIKLTTDDPVEGMVTTVPFDVSVAVPVDKGQGKLKTTMNDILGAAGFSSLGECWAGEITGIIVEDPGGFDFGGGVNPAFSERGVACCATRG